MDQPESQVEAPLHAAGIGLDRLARPAAEPHPGQRRLHRLAERLPRKTVEAAPEAEVLRRRQLFVDGDVLRHDSELALAAQGIAGKIDALERNAAGVWSQ